jgi:hypothetical protein
MILYISGKMSGLPDLGHVAFDRAENRLVGLGHQVINPARLSDDLPRTAYMPICLAMLQQAEALVLLPGWQDSPGAKVEKAFAEYQEMPVHDLAYFWPQPKLEVNYNGSEPICEDLYR